MLMELKTTNLTPIHAPAYTVKNGVCGGGC